ncbi:MAG TPA: hypothetical protein VFC19_05850 [Candidatus Limnocylindrales bacterium]|nr:hypothetical protein [Candidatus Limnocylindrales bacterium]
MAHWRRADPVGMTTLITGVFFAIGAAFVVLVTVAFVLGVKWHVNPLLGAAGFYGFMALWLGFVWRMNRTGAYVSDQAIRLVRLLRTRKLPWTQVAEVYSAPAMLGTRATSRNAIWVRLRDGSRIETPIQCRAGRLGISMHANIGRLLSPTRFDATLQVLREAHRRAAGTR